MSWIDSSGFRHSYGDDRSPEALRFLDEIEAVMTKHGFQIEHEDGHGAFVIRRESEGGSSWVHDAREVRKAQP